MESVSNQAVFAGESWSVFHAISPQDRTATDQIRAMVAPFKGKLRGVAGRVPFNAMMGQATAAPESVRFRPDTVGGVAGWWCEPAAASPDAVILHAHGGWFTWGSAEVFRNFVGHIARSARAKAFVTDYRLAPKHPFPAASEDLYACYQGLVANGATSIALTGDSAGGNLALGLLARITAEASGDSSTNRKVVAVVALSPITDLTMTGPSWESRAEADPYFVRDQAEELIRGYLAGYNPKDPAASPLYGDLAGLPPIRVHVGDDEMLLDDSRGYAERAAATGVDARVDVWEGMPHGFVGAVGRLDAAAQALTAIGSFLSEQFAASRNT